MKKIIKGKKYDTETATKLGSWFNGYSYSDFNYVNENLYLKKTGEYFLHGEGGALSKYAKYNASNGVYEGSSVIKPLSKEEAMEWAEDKLDVDKYEEIFGEVEE